MFIFYWNRRLRTYAIFKNQLPLFTHRSTTINTHITYLKFIESIFSISNPTLRDLKSSLILSKAWRIKYFTNPLFSFPFPKVQSCSTGMSEDVPADWFLWVYMSHCISWVCHYLVGHVYGHVELLG